MVIKPSYSVSLTDVPKGIIGPNDPNHIDILPHDRANFYRDIERKIEVNSCARAGHLVGKTVLLKRGDPEEELFTMAISVIGFGRVETEDYCSVLGNICSLEEVRIGRRCAVGKNIISRRAEIHSHTFIKGNILATSDINIGSDCDINGSVVSLTGNVTIGDRCNIGLVYARGQVRMGQDIRLLNDLVMSEKGKVVFPSDGEDPALILAHTFSVINNENIEWDEVSGYCYDDAKKGRYNLNRVIFQKSEKIIEERLGNLNEKWGDVSVPTEKKDSPDVYERLGYRVEELLSRPGSIKVYGDVVQGDKTTVKDSVVIRSGIG